MLLFKADYIANNITLPTQLQKQTKSLFVRIANAEIMYIHYKQNTNNSIFPLPTVWTEALACHYTTVRLEH